MFNHGPPGQVDEDGCSLGSTEGQACAASLLSECTDKPAPASRNMVDCCKINLAQNLLQKALEKRQMFALSVQQNDNDIIMANEYVMTLLPCRFGACRTLDITASACSELRGLLTVAMR